MIARIGHIILYVAAIAPSVGLCQSTVVKGRVIDRATGEPLPFVNIAFVDSKIGTTTAI